MTFAWTLLTILGGAQDQEPNLADAISEAARRIRDRVAHSVVAIEVERIKDPHGTAPRGSFSEQGEYYSRPKGPCTGTIVSADGHIATTAFNMSGEIKTMTVRVAGRDKPLPAKLLGFDEDKDIALIKVEAAGLPVLPKAELSGIKVGNFAFAIGRAPEPETPTVNFGVLSALHRFGASHVQTDAELNYGNVGGPLVDLEGRLLGITTHIGTRAFWGQSGGVGFALRHDEFEKLLPDLKAGKKARAKPRIVLGIMGSPSPAETPGVEVTEVLPGSPAALAGIQVGDVVIEFDGAEVTSPAEIARIMAKKKAGDRIDVALQRGAQKLKVTISLFEPEEY